MPGVYRVKIFKQRGRTMNKRDFEQLYMDLLPGLYRLAQGIFFISYDGLVGFEFAFLL